MGLGREHVAVARERLPQRARLLAHVDEQRDPALELTVKSLPSPQQIDALRNSQIDLGFITVPAPHGLHTDHSAEDPKAAGEPICIARIETLGTHYVAGDYSTYDAGTQSMLKALRYWTAVPEGQPDEVLAKLLGQGTLRSIPVDHVMLMVAGNGSADAQVTQHIAARPPPGGLHSAFFQRQYRLPVVGGL